MHMLQQKAKCKFTSINSEKIIFRSFHCKLENLLLFWIHFRVGELSEYRIWNLKFMCQAVRTNNSICKTLPWSYFFFFFSCFSSLRKCGPQWNDFFIARLSIFPKSRLVACLINSKIQNRFILFILCSSYLLRLH